MSVALGTWAVIAGVVSLASCLATSILVIRLHHRVDELLRCARSGR